jgi:hypothetical protein
LSREVSPTPLVGKRDSFILPEKRTDGKMLLKEPLTPCLEDSRSIAEALSDSLFSKAIFIDSSSE